MKKYIAIVITAGTTFLFGRCDTPDPQFACNPVTGVSVIDSCYSSTLGLRVSPSGYSDYYNSKPTFKWIVYPLKDTVSNILDKGYEFSSIGSTNIVIPDSILKNIVKVKMIVTNTCAGTDFSSLQISLSKRKYSTCTKWQK